VLTILADESTDITSTEEMSVCFHWVENGEAVEHFLEVIHLKETNAGAITTALQEYLKQKDINPVSIIGMGFDGATTFSGKISGVQARLKLNSPYAAYIPRKSHKLELACIQAENSSPLIKRVFSNLTALWKIFHFSPKKAEKLKEVQELLGLPELKVVAPSDTRWLAHERCIKAVKSSYCGIIAWKVEMPKVMVCQRFSKNPPQLLRSIFFPKHCQAREF